MPGVHRLTANHDYGNFVVEVAAPPPQPAEPRRPVYTTSNAIYGNYWALPYRPTISLLETIPAIKRTTQGFNFMARDTTSKELGVAYSPHAWWEQSASAIAVQRRVAAGHKM